MAKVLILFAHPLLETSRVHTALLNGIKGMKGVTIHDLYEQYPDFDIDKEKEKALLLAHDIIIWQHPFYWYSAPALLKQWQDLVLEHGWAYGKHGQALEGKKVFNVFSSGGSSAAYEAGGRNQYSIQQFLIPFERTAALCRMTYWPPFWVAGVHKMESDEINLYAAQYRALLRLLTADQIEEAQIQNLSLLNELSTLTLKHL